MQKRYRYGLLALGMAFFFIAAPALVLYIKGIAWDAETRNFIHTGIAAFKIEPEPVVVKIDGNETGQSSGTIRFVRPGKHLFEFTKNGYHSFFTLAETKAGEAIWIRPKERTIRLIAKIPNQTDISQDVYDFIVTKKSIIYLNKQGINIWPQNTAFKFTEITPETKILSESNDILFLKNKIGTISAFNIASGKKLNIQIPSQAKNILATSDGHIWFIHNGNLFYSSAPQFTNQLFSEKVLSLSSNNQWIYYIQNLSKSPTLFSASSPNSTPQNFSSNLPQAATYEIFAAYDNEIFTQADGRLYLLTDPPTDLGDTKDTLKTNPSRNSLIFARAGELTEYSFVHKKTKLILRTQNTLKPLGIWQNWKYALFESNGNLYAAETDFGENLEIPLLLGAPYQKAAPALEDGKIIVLINGTLREYNFQ